MSQTNHDIFAEQYVLEYERLRNQYPFWSYKMVLIKAKESTVEYLYQLLKSELKVKPVWPKEFIRPEGGL